MPAPDGQHPRADDELEAPLGRSLAETERLNRPGHRAGEQARAAVRRQTSMGRPGTGRRGFVISILVLLALIALVGVLVRITQG
jgi:hypothetical protein